ncbi:hypothetical protein BO83DRAFT_47338 [Aspergillus eucalypticola CBS 122712]|uniref:Uncharacterized protein n=1 Tax=Aspergillus eucalypticola (strain CBS 122712 / IBT 29274) TaxID=1448314 RepID=A0A317VCR4_ASPEC|nr:uncharacterized protein BO83DRAFT_47338 [Aspergillus eucalypticola CBS 122712]PWY72046.1 hypothetical protein BO83DRAFT_47338 [Aspergillus eucalypticola CBS 122712]
MESIRKVRGERERECVCVCEGNTRLLFRFFFLCFFSSLFASSTFLSKNRSKSQSPSNIMRNGYSVLRSQFHFCKSSSSRGCVVYCDITQLSSPYFAEELPLVAHHIPRCIDTYRGPVFGHRMEQTLPFLAALGI